MINTKERLKLFLSDTESRNRYKRAITDLEELHIFDILREIQSEVPISVGAVVDGQSIDLMQYHVLHGYMQALNDIEYLVESREPAKTIGSPDFGAEGKLMNEGYTKEEIRKMFEEE